MAGAPHASPSLPGRLQMPEKIVAPQPERRIRIAQREAELIARLAVQRITATDAVHGLAVVQRLIAVEAPDASQVLIG